MFPLRSEILESSREFDNLFQLDETPRKSDYSPRTWKVAQPRFFKGCDSTEIFPLAVNLYLKVCDESELIPLMEKKNYLRVSMYYEGEDCEVSCISVSNLDIERLKDPKYQELLLSCPEDRIPVEINLGPLWHYLALSKTMVKNRRVELGFTTQNLNSFPLLYCEIGLELIGRDAYPQENTEEKIQQAEEADQIFILRK